MKAITIELGGSEFEISELPARKNAAYRQRVTEELGSITAVLRQADPELELSDLSSVADLIDQAGGFLLGSVDTIADLVISYSPVLQAQEDRILDTAFDSELFAAFVQILGLAFPFGQMLNRGRVILGDLSK